MIHSRAGAMRQHVASPRVGGFCIKPETRVVSLTVMVTDLAAVEVMDTKLTHAFVYFCFFGR
jgi:hypothetical protein